LKKNDNLKNSTKKYINRLISEEPEVPCVQSIIFPNGEILKFEIVSNDTENKESIIVLEKITIDSYFEENNYEDVSHCNYTTSTENDEYTVSCGDGSWGSDGIVSVIKKSENRLLWIIFSDNSNPFYKVEIEDDIVIAGSTSGKNWKIPINSPEKLEIRT